MIASAILIGFVALIIGLIFLFKSIIGNAGKRLQALPASKELPKKFPDVDIHRYKNLFAALGLAISLGMVLTAFEWKTFEDLVLVTDPIVTKSIDDELQTQVTNHTPPPPPVKIQPVIIEVPDDTKIEEPEAIFDTETKPDEAIKPTVLEPVVETVVAEEPDENIFITVEENAVPEGGYEAYYKYLKKTLKYPSQARRMGTEGKVYVQFVVDKEGLVTEAKVIKGIGGGCDEEALRIMEGTKWSPGKQRGRAVKQRIVMQIVFRLN